MWELIDHTGSGKGYMRITKDGKRVADVFPFAADQDADWTVEAAREIVAKMNEREKRLAESQ